MAEVGSQTTDYPEWVTQIQDETMIREQVIQIPEEKKPTAEARRIYNRLPPAVQQRPDVDNVYKVCTVELGPLNATREIGKDKVKEDTLTHFLRIHNIKIKACYDALRKVANKLRDAYDGLEQRWLDDPDSFLRMMLLDGCFLFEFVRMSNDYSHLFPKPLAPDAENNPVIKSILDDDTKRKAYVHDILLLVNQLPAMLLFTLITVVFEREDSDYGDVLQGFRLFLREFRIMELRSLDIFGELESSKHLLDVYRKNLLHHKNKRSGKTTSELTVKFSNTDIMIPSATTLHNDGIGFAISKSTSQLDIQLRRKTLMLPNIVIKDSTKSRFLNLIAFEQLHKNEVDMEFTTYMYFMGWLVRNAEDVSLLQSRGIINTNGLADTEVAELFKIMYKDISNDSGNDVLAPAYVDMLTTVKERYNRILLRKDRVRTYLETPWKVASTIAAIVLFTLTTIQTVFTVLGYYSGK